MPQFRRLEINPSGSGYSHLMLYGSERYCELFQSDDGPMGKNVVISFAALLSAACI